jgi:hypothetical protein
MPLGHRTDLNIPLKQVSLSQRRINMKLISYENKLYFCFEAKILTRSLGIMMLPAKDKDIDQIEQAIKSIRAGTPIDAKSA